MPLEFDKRVSWMDIFAICGVLITGATVFFGVSEDVLLNSQHISHIRADVKRIERGSEQHEKKILKMLEDQKAEMKEYRQESRDGQRQVVDKLDRLIERELNSGNGH